MRVCTCRQIAGGWVKMCVNVKPGRARARMHGYGHAHAHTDTRVCVCAHCSSMLPELKQLQILLVGVACRDMQVVKEKQASASMAL